MADSCLASLSANFVSKNSFHCLFPLRSKTTSLLRLSLSSSSLSSPSLFLSVGKEKIPSVVTHVARTSDWIGEGSTGWKGENKFKSSDGDEMEEGDAFAEGESPVDEEFAGGETEEYAKLFVGNLPYDIDSEKLARLFQKAGIVEVAEVIYNRETDQSRGFGFVTMSTVEEAEQAVEIFNRYDWNGRLLTVNIAAPRGSRPEKNPPTREFEPSLKIYVGNLPWRVDDAGLEQIFSEHGEVLSARVLYDRESGRSRGFGFVTMASKAELDDAIAALDGQKLEGRAIRVNVAEERPQRGSF